MRELISAARNTPIPIESKLFLQFISIIDENNIIFINEFGICCSSRVQYGKSLLGTTQRKQIRSVSFRNYSDCAVFAKQGY
jgi:hypothetical protein